MANQRIRTDSLSPTAGLKRISVKKREFLHNFSSRSELESMLRAVNPFAARIFAREGRAAEALFMRQFTDNVLKAQEGNEEEDEGERQHRVE